MSKLKQIGIKDNATEGERLKYVRELLKLSLVDFATPLQKHLSAVQKWEVSGRSLDKANLLLLEKIWSINPDFIRTGNGNPFIKSSNDTESATWLVYDILDKPYAGSLNLDAFSPIEAVPHISNFGELLFVKATTNKIPGVLKDDVIGIKRGLEELPPKHRSEGQYLAVYKNYITLKYLCFLDGGILSVENNSKSPIKISLSLLQREEILIMGKAFTIRRNIK